MELEVLKKVELKDIDLKDAFFDSLKSDYSNFQSWFANKSEEGLSAYVKYDELENIKTFLMLQIKDTPEEDIIPKQTKIRRIKISTMKVDSDSTSQRLSEAMINIVFSEMDLLDVDEAYVTLFEEKQKKLCDVLVSWGFVKTGNKGSEIVLTKFKNRVFKDIKKDYKWYFNKTNFDYYERKSNFYLLPFDSEYHDKLFPDNKLWRVTNKAKEFDTSSISISKTYLSKTNYSVLPKAGDFLLEYRKSDDPPKRFKSVVSGVGVIVNVIDGRLFSFDKWRKEVGNTSVFGTEKELKKQFSDEKRKIIIKFLHIFSFGENNNVSYSWLKENGIWLENDGYLPSHPIKNKDDTIKLILEKWGNQNENLNGNSRGIHK